MTIREQVAKKAKHLTESNIIFYIGYPSLEDCINKISIIVLFWYIDIAIANNFGFIYLFIGIHIIYRLFRER